MLVGPVILTRSRTVAPLTGQVMRIDLLLADSLPTVKEAAIYACVSDKGQAEDGKTSISG